MTAKTNGAEFEAFYADQEWWRDLIHDDTVIEVDGVEYGDDIDMPSIDWLGEIEEGKAVLEPDSRVRILNGVVHRDQEGSRGESLDSFFQRWRKRRNTSRLVVEVDRDRAAEAKEAIGMALSRNSIKGKVIQ